jgi:hypothetical protein
MLMSTPTTTPRTARRAAPQKLAKPASAPARAVPRLDEADKAVFEAIANSPSFSLSALQKLAARNAQ